MLKNLKLNTRKVEQLKGRKVDTDRQTHQYNDSAWPRVRAEGKGRRRRRRKRRLRRSKRRTRTTRRKRRTKWMGRGETRVQTERVSCRLNWPRWSSIKLDGVGPVDNRPSTD